LASLASTLVGAGALVRGLLRSYAQILLARSLVSGALLLAATALDWPTCLGGLAAVAGGSVVARAMTLADGALSDGPYGYNALFAGLAIGHFFGAGPGCLALAAGWGGLTVVLTSAFVSTAGKLFGLPALTVPFLLATYLLLFVAPVLGLTARLATVAVSAAPAPAADWLAWVGALVFAPRAEAGLLVLAALLVHSRIALLLGASGALVLYPVLRHAGLPPALAAPLLFNGVLAAISLGGTWFVPGPASFALAAAGAALCALATLAFQRVLAFWGLPLLVLPFNVVVLLVLCAMRQRTRDRSPKAVDFTPGSPERNLRFYQTRILRAGTAVRVAFGLPFRGSWICTQGIDGAHTHQGPWRHAFDFEVAGQDGRVRVGDRGDDLARYHCYGLPVLAAADGTVVKVEADVPDNPIGGMDLDRNWGNVVVLYHAPGLYSLVAHLAPRSVTVREGQAVTRGEVVGSCGSSGRSPQPHLHFQLQGSPILGAPTLPCVFESGVLSSEPSPRLVTGVVPREHEVWRNAEPDPDLAEQLGFPVGTEAVYRVNGHAERLVSEVDLYGQALLRSSGGGVLTFARTPGQLTILDVEAPGDSLLHALRAALGRVPLTAEPGVWWYDDLPPAWRAGRARAALRAALAPFLPADGVPMEYRYRREGGVLAVSGRALRARRDGSPLVVSLAILDARGWPAVVDVDAGASRVHAEQLAPSAVVPPRRGGASDGPRPGADRPFGSRVIPLPTRVRSPAPRPREA
jgi:murein DD-endopeptidase MepM/ murein hydrolase activator NlpD